MTAPVRVACPHCQAGLKLRSREYLQRKITCPGCQQSFVPEPEQAFDMLDVVDDEPDELETESPAPSAPTPLKRSAEPANVPFAQGAVATRSTDGPTLLGDDDFVSAPVARGDSRGGHPSVSRPEPAFDALEVIEDDPEEFDYEAPPSPTPQRGNRNLEPAIDPPPAKSTPARPAARAKSQREEEADDDRESQPQRGTTSRSKRRPKSSGVPWRGMIVVAVVLSVALGLFLVPWRTGIPRGIAEDGGFAGRPSQRAESRGGRRRIEARGRTAGCDLSPYCPAVTAK
ncbi:MAG: hypothetical protein NT069_14195 [Planctomycetota bacterium]|nr:hypothetical protein [Planctomycetota bacterium]